MPEYCLAMELALVGLDWIGLHWIGFILHPQEKEGSLFQTPYI